MLQLMHETKQSMHMEGRYIQTDEFRAILNTLFKIPREQCRALGWLYAASRVDSMPHLQTISLSGSHAAVHCYVYAKYISKHWSKSFDPMRMDALLLQYLAAYGPVQR